MRLLQSIFYVDLDGVHYLDFLFFYTSRILRFLFSFFGTYTFVFAIFGGLLPPPLLSVTIQALIGDRARLFFCCID